MFTGTSDGRVVKLENGEIETIARFGSGPCSKLVMPHSESCPFPPDVTFTVGELLTIWQTGHAVVSPWFLIAGWSSGLGVPSPWLSLWCLCFPVGHWSCDWVVLVLCPLIIPFSLWLPCGNLISVGGAALYKDRGFVTVGGLRVIP